MTPDLKPDITLGDLLGVVASLALGVLGWAFGRFVLQGERRMALLHQLHQQASLHLQITSRENEIEAHTQWAELIRMHCCWQRPAWRRAFKAYRTACAEVAQTPQGKLIYVDTHAVRRALRRLLELADLKTV